jgi:retinoid hydroxylase
MGLPLLGETLAFVRNPYRFLEERQARHGNVFKSNVVGRKVVFLAGVDGAEAFYDGENISREDAHPFLMVEMFGGVNFEMYDGPRHAALKGIALGAFDEATIAGYLSDMEALVTSSLARLAGLGAFAATSELRRLAIEAICRNLMGLAPGPETEAITRDYGTLLAGLASALPARMPGTRYGRAMAARDRLLARIKGLIQERRRRPLADGLSRMLSSRAPDGRTYTDEEAVLEVHHIVVAGFVVYALMVEVVRQLALRPDLLERCAAEVRDMLPGPLDMEGLGRLRTSTNVVLEAKRFVPLVPLAFGRARRAFSCGGFDIPERWAVYLALHLCSRDRAIYREPDRFDPDRFGPDRAEHLSHPMAFIPQGAEPPTGHRCLGLDYSTILVLSFLALLVRDYEWRLPPQDLSFDWKRRPPEPRDGLRVELAAR